LFDAIQGAVDLGLDWFTVYAFSTENWRRPAEEVRFLLNVISDQLLLRRRDQLNEMGVRIRFIGRRDWRVPKRVLHRMDESVEMTKHNRRMTFTVAFNYGGRAEIVDAARAIAEDVASGRLKPGDVSEKVFQRYLYEPGLGDVDLFLRTSGEQRTSNFLLWQSAYAELMFLDTLWPDFDRRHLWDACAAFAGRDRRYGGAVDGPTAPTAPTAPSSARPTPAQGPPALPNGDEPA
jgi:undecaprenyl diphosphate synthase